MFLLRKAETKVIALWQPVAAQRKSQLSQLPGRLIPQVGSCIQRSCLGDSKASWGTLPPKKDVRVRLYGLVSLGFGLYCTRVLGLSGPHSQLLSSDIYLTPSSCMFTELVGLAPQRKLDVGMCFKCKSVRRLFQKT